MIVNHSCVCVKTPMIRKYGLNWTPMKNGAKAMLFSLTG